MTNENGKHEDKVLRCDAAIAKWKEGKDEWNAWVQDHPDWGVDFSRVDFSEHVEPGNTVDFKAHHFPKGIVDFNNAQFGEGQVDFRAAQFGGNVVFVRAQFGGQVDFRHTQFGGAVSFFDAEFGTENVDVDFAVAKFGGHVDFSRAQFGEGQVDFSRAQFDRDVAFSRAQFGGNVDFNYAKFSGDVAFRGAQFGGNVAFSYAKFSGSEVHFGGARFGEGSFLFVYTQMQDVKYLIFKFARWKGSVHFMPNINGICKVINFSSASIEGELALGPIDTTCVIDLRHTKLAHPIDLDKVNVNYRFRDFPKRFFLMRLPIAYKQDASTCFRRLKKLAKDADDHERALDFFAKEMRSSYGRELRGWRLFLYLLYDNISDYGRSITIPAKWLCIMVQFYGLVYFLLSTFAAQSLYSMSESLGRLGSSLTFSLAHALPFYFGSREANADTMESLFTTNPPDYLHWLTISQGMVCGVLLFLIALALRNYFRS